MSAATSPSPTGPYLVGRPHQWARDFGVIGLFSGTLAPATLAMVCGWPVVAASGFVGGCGGALLGAMAPSMLERVRGRVPLPALLLLGLPIGAVWGASSGFAAGLTYQLLSGDTVVLPPFLWAWVAAMAGAMQLGLVWFPYTFLRVLDKPTWPVVAASCAGSAALGPLAIAMILFGLWTWL